MSISDFISKTASDALGRIIAAAPEQFTKIFTSAVWIESPIDFSLWFYARKHLESTAIKLWAPVSGYHSMTFGTGRHALEAHPRIDRTVYLAERKTLLTLRTFDDKGYTKYSLGYVRGTDVASIFKKALLGLEVSRGGYLRKLSMKKDAEGAELGLGAPIKPGKFWESPALAALLSDGKNWFASAEACQEKNLPWRRGWLLHGPPGNGKSKAAQILANAIGVDLIPVNLAVAQYVFDKMWTEVQRAAPCIVLMEDVDDVFRGRQNIKMPDIGVSFSTLINAIDGAESVDGVAIVVTTNDLSAIDPALGKPRDESHWNQLSTRPGRLDRCLRFDNPDLEGRIAIGKLYLPEQDAKRLAHEHDDVSLVQFQALCRELAFAQIQDLQSA